MPSGKIDSVRPKKMHQPLGFGLLFMVFHKDNRNLLVSCQPVQTVIYQLLSFVWPVFGCSCGKSFGSADNQGADETAVHYSLCLTENYINCGILLVKDIDGANCLLLRNEKLNGLFVAVQGDTEDRCVPLLAKYVRHLGNQEGRAHFVSGADASFGKNSAKAKSYSKIKPSSKR